MPPWPSSRSIAYRSARAAFKRARTSSMWPFKGGRRLHHRYGGGMQPGGGFGHPRVDAVPAPRHPPVVTSTAPILAPELARAVAAQRDRLDLDLVSRAYRVSAQAHRGQKRESGDDYVSHSVAVATILAEQLMDSTTIAAALLHDVVEDSDTSLEDIRRDFGTEVAELVDGLTKLSTLTFRSTAEEQAENYRKLLLSVAKDARVIIIKLADRLHNMRTLEHLDPDKQHRIALETREIYAPLAHRFGMAGVKAELEDLAFKFLEPEDYRTLARNVKAKRLERERTIERLHAPLGDALREAGLADIEITGRPKNLWSIYKKMRKRGKPFEEIYDLLAVRVLVNNIPECYHVLGAIPHSWTPLQERIKDYIASPKSNGYQSLHTTVFGPGGQLYEIQIRTREMHHTAEYGIAAHWLFKEGRKSPDELDRHLAWFRQLLELQQDAHTPEEFLEFLKVDLYQDEIFVFTPRGDVKRLPKGATPIDFAFAVHTEVGQHCQGARINGRIAPLHRPLKNGDTVEVMTSLQAKPSRDWLAHVQTARARHKIRQWISREEHEKSLELGQEILAREIRRRRLTAPDAERLERAAAALSVGTAEQLQAALGRGDLGRGIKIQGVDGLMVRYAQCCQPVPGDPVVGYVTQGRGISIHRSDCPNLLTLSVEMERRVEIDWQEVEGEVFVVRLSVSGEDRRGLYAEICEASRE